ncbi:uncharacterized protein [Aristolochia californica]|uniref:uncharacterized protein n=1 Tax=Aristolochia californica TaxID=171875 RepID=UPI0035DE9877
MVVGNMQTVKVCGICSVVGHPTNISPTFQEEPIEQVNAAGGFPGQPQRKYDPYSNTYNMGWRYHPNLSYGNPQETRASIQSLDNQMATAIKRLEAQSSGKLPSQTVVNPRENASAIILRTGKEVEIRTLADSRKYEQNKDLYETFCRCQINISLLDAIKQVPHYLKFLKELCTIKRKQKLKGYEKVRVGENVPAVIQRKLPTKYKYPGMFTFPCPLGNIRFEKAMIDLGASINVMPYSLYASLKLGPLNKTGVVIQLSDRSNAYPKVVLEDVLVQVNDFIFPADFDVLDMENGDQTTPILLG